MITLDKYIKQPTKALSTSFIKALTTVGNIGINASTSSLVYALVIPYSAKVLPSAMRPPTMN